MRSGNCYRKGFECGPWYNAKAMIEIVESQKSKGKDASFGLGLLKSWAKYPGYELAKEYINDLKRGKSMRRRVSL